MPEICLSGTAVLHGGALVLRDRPLETAGRSQHGPRRLPLMRGYTWASRSARQRLAQEVVSVLASAPEGSRSIARRVLIGVLLAVLQSAILVPVRLAVAPEAVAPEAAADVPPPDIAAFLPAHYRVTDVKDVDLDGASVDEVAVTAVGTVVAQGVVPTTVFFILLAWDMHASKWMAVFNVARLSSYQTETQEGQKGPGLILSTGLGPKLAVIRDLSGRGASLAYWVPAIGGNTKVWLIGIVNFRNQVADLAWSDDLNIAHIVSYGAKPQGFFPLPAVVG